MKKPVLRFILVGALLAVTASLIYGLPHAIAVSPDNKVNADFRTAWVYDSPGGNFTNSQVTGYKWWQTAVGKPPDATGSSITSLSLSLKSSHVFENLNATSLVTKGPPTYEWKFDGIPPGNEPNAWVDSRLSSGSVSAPVTFTPGFDASRSADKTKFSAPGTQTLTIDVTPREAIQGITIFVGVMENQNADLIITSPTSDNNTRLSPDGHTLKVNLTDLQVNVTYTTIVTTQVTPKTSEVTFLPNINVMESNRVTASGSDSGNSISHPVDESDNTIGVWTWQTQSDCVWQWQASLSRWVSFKGIDYGPQGQGTGKSNSLPQPAFNWRFDIGLAIGLLAISPGLYLAGRRFRRQKRSLNLTRVVYPLIISLTGWYIFTSIYNMVHVPNWSQGPDVLVHLPMSTISLAFSYAAIKKVKLEFKWTALSVAGMVLAAYFLVVAIAEFFNPVISKYNLFFSGIWDHTFFPLSFGLLMLCDLNKMPKMFWFILLPMSLAAVGSVRIILTELISGIPAANPNAPSLMFYFGVKNLTQILAIPQDKLMVFLIIFLREELGFILLLPTLSFYYFFKSLGKSISGLIKRHSESSLRSSGP